MRLLTAKDVAARLNISERSALRLLRRGEIQAFQIGGKLWRVPEQNVAAYLARELERNRKAA